MALARDRILLTADVVTGASTNYTPVTGLAFGVVAAKRYHVKAFMMSTVAATTTGVRYGLSANPTTAATLNAMLLWTADTVGTIDGGGVTGFVTTASTTGGVTAPASSSDTAGHITIVEFFVQPSVAQIVQLECGPEAAAAVTICKGSYLEWELIG